MNVYRRNGDDSYTKIVDEGNIVVPKASSENNVKVYAEGKLIGKITSYSYSPPPTFETIDTVYVLWERSISGWSKEIHSVHVTEKSAMAMKEELVKRSNNTQLVYDIKPQRLVEQRGGS